MCILSVHAVNNTKSDFDLINIYQYIYILSLPSANPVAEAGELAVDTARVGAAAELVVAVVVPSWLLLLDPPVAAALEWAATLVRAMMGQRLAMFRS